MSAVARRSVAAQSADRRDRQHASRRVLYRQAVFAGRADGAARTARDACVRDAAARADEPRRSSCCCVRSSRSSAHEPYAPERLARWGTELHDRFHAAVFRRAGFERRARRNCRAAGLSVASPSGSHPHFEFRFPKYGDFATHGVEVELRQALEPWHVMGEEGAPGGAVRYVDSSVERLQVKVSGLAPDRYVDDLQWPRRCRCVRPARSASSSAAFAIARGNLLLPCIRRSVCTRR